MTENDATQKARKFQSKPYTAPEAFDNAGPAMDVWSLGIILFVMLVGEYPNRNSSSHRLTEGAQRLINNMLEVDPARRITVPQIMNHAWLASDSAFISTNHKMATIDLKASGDNMSTHIGGKQVELSRQSGTSKARTTLVIAAILIPVLLALGRGKNFLY